jgi:prefoldin subunit 5
MAQKNIKDVKKESKKVEIKKDVKKVEHKKDIKHEVKNEVKTVDASKVPQKKIQLSPQDAYKFFNEEKKKLESIARDLEQTESALLDLDKTIFALKEIKETKDKDVMINLGMGLFIKAKLEDTKKIFAITAGKAVIPKSPETLLEQLTKRKTNAFNSAKRLQQVQGQTQQNINQLYKFLSAHEQRMKQQAQQNRQ